MLVWKERRTCLLIVCVTGALLAAASAASSRRSRRVESCPQKPPKLEPLLQHVHDVGGYYHGDNGQPLGEWPHWLDVSLLRAGQKFTRDNLQAIFFTEFQGLFILFLLSYELQPLLFSGASDTPEKAFVRYRSTVIRVLSWYDEDLLDKGSEAYRNLLTVRSFHANMRKRILAASPEEIANRTKVTGGMWCPLTSRLRRDFAETICPSKLLENKVYKEVPMSQKAMAYTQFGFVGLMFAYPEAYGVRPTKREFQGFAHLWAFIGHQLGITDEFNMCLGDISTVQHRMRQFVEYIAKPQLAEIKPEWEHMARVMADGISRIVPSASFHVGLKRLLDIIGVPSPSLSAAMTPTHRSTLAFYEQLVAAQRRGAVGTAGINQFVRILLNASKNMTIIPRPPPGPADCPADNFV